jgi:hypothetical protein
MIPPCQLSEAKPRTAATFVAKVSEAKPGLLVPFGSAALVHGAGAFALVEVPGTGCYFVLSGTERGDAAYARNLEQQIKRLPEAPDVEWVRPLTVRLQRLLGWGDVTADEIAVQKAIDAEDVEELQVLMPAAKALIGRGELEHLPAVLAALRCPQPALSDCQHRFERLRGVLECGLGTDRSHRGPFSKCLDCCAVRCASCVLAWGSDVAERRAVTQALHQVTGHEWPPICGGQWITTGSGRHFHKSKAECTLCGTIPASVCSCGAQRCLSCQQPDAPALAALAALAPTCQWWQHPTCPRPFYVIDQARASDGDKLLWIRHELGDGADIATFGKKMVELFGKKLRGDMTQKSICLRLWAEYAPEEKKGDPAWKCESDLPPNVLTAFQGVWDKNAKQRCQECSKELTGKCSRTTRFCSDDCANAGAIMACRRCGMKDKDFPTTQWLFCSNCKVGAAPISRSRHAADKQTPQEVSLALLNKIQNGWFGDMRKDPEHEAAWKKRRRS